MIINAEKNVIGRLGSYVAKKLLSGESVIIINAEKAIFTGDKKSILKKYLARRAIKQKANPEHSPKWPRRPDLLLKRIIRGMLPYDKFKGRKAYKLLKVYIGFPKEIKEKVEKEKINIEEGKFIKDVSKFVTLEEICRELGWNPG